MSTRSTLRLVTIPDPNTALGVAARFMMNHPAFAERGFGEWVRVLDGQARRGHQAFVLNDEDRMVGYLGYAHCIEAIAQAWLRKGYNPTHEECLAGDCIIFNAWISEDARVRAFLWDAFRRMARDKKAVFYKRFYADGTVRPGRLAITPAIDRHIQRTRLKQGADAVEAPAVTPSTNGTSTNGTGD